MAKKIHIKHFMYRSINKVFFIHLFPLAGNKAQQLHKQFLYTVFTIINPNLIH